MVRLREEVEAFSKKYDGILDSLRVDEVPLTSFFILTPRRTNEVHRKLNVDLLQYMFVSITPRQPKLHVSWLI